MSFSERAYLLILATALLAVVGVWSSDPALEGLWRLPLALLLLGLALESFLAREFDVFARVRIAPRAFLGREEQGAFAFTNHEPRDLTIEYLPLAPPGVELLRPSPAAARRLKARGESTTLDPFTLAPVRLGPQEWPRLQARVLGPFGLAWWPRQLAVAREFGIAPDTLNRVKARPRGAPAGMQPRRVVGAGAQLHQLRAYVPGDPLARIDWKATARTGQLISREFTEDQHLDILIAMDAGRLSRIRAGNLDRLGLYANIAARFAEVVTHNDDRVGLIVFADRPLTLCTPDRGLPAVARLRRALEKLSAQAAESNPMAAAARIRSMLRHRSLIVWLTDLDDASIAKQLARSVKLLCPPHLAVIAGVQSAEIAALAHHETRNWRGPWVALAAQEHEWRARTQRGLLKRLGAPVIAVREDLLEEAVFAEYEALRRQRRI